MYSAWRMGGGRPMTTNKPEVVAWLRNERGEYARGPATFDPMCVFGSREPQGLEASYSPVVMLSDYEALQAECEKLRKDAEFGRSVLAKREPGKVYGCHCDLDEGMEPDSCVIDSGERNHCVYAKSIEVKEQCEYWRVIAKDSAIQENN